LALRELGIEISIGSLKMEFNCPRTAAAVKKALRNGLDWSHRNRVIAIMLSRTSQRQKQISSPGFSIKPKSSNHRSSTRTNILHYCASKFGKVITRGWVDSFVIWHQNELTEMISKPQENAPLQVHREFLLGITGEMDEAVQSCVCDLVFNLDEVGVGVSEWEGRKSKTVVVSAVRGNQAIHHGVNRNLKHIIVITYVATSGKHVIPYIITSHRRNHTTSRKR
jgi:hypothetical protein